MAAAEASLDPQMAAKPPQAIVVAMARPPLTLPIHLLAALYRSPAIPVSETTIPMRIYKGTQAKT